MGTNSKRKRVRCARIGGADGSADWNANQDDFLQVASISKSQVVIWSIPADACDVDATIAAILLAAARLHPFGHGYPGFLGRDVRHAKVAQPRAALRHQRSFGVAKDA